MDEGALGAGVGFAEDFEDGLDALGLDFELGDAVAVGLFGRGRFLHGAVGGDGFGGRFFCGLLYRFRRSLLCGLFR